MEEATNGTITNYILICPGEMLRIINCSGHLGELLAVHCTEARSAGLLLSQVLTLYIVARPQGSSGRGELSGGSRRS